MHITFILTTYNKVWKSLAINTSPFSSQQAWTLFYTKYLQSQKLQKEI